MKTFPAIMVLLIGCHFGNLLSGEEYSRSQLAYFERYIRPVLVKQCIECHGPQRQEGGLRLDSREAVLRGGARGPSVNLEAPAASLLVKAVSREDDLAMPPENELDDDIVHNFQRWIKQGAAWPKKFNLPPDLDPKQHWAFQQIRNPPVPAVTPGNDTNTTVDAFVISRLNQHELTLAKTADKRTLIRRLYQDLIGLPPTIQQTEAFLKDENSEAYLDLVDRALDDNQFGVHWARMWMDISRYADNKGYIFYLNREFQWAFTYRDYLIESFNEDRSYQQMILEQLAADQIVERDLKPLRAMGFVTLGDYFVNNKHDMIDDRIDVITRGLLGLTVTCARCHDHKFDPIPTADYYGLYGVLDNSHDPIVPPLYKTPPETTEYLEFDRQLQSKKKALDDFVNTTINALKEDGRTRIAGYLIAAYNERNKPDSDEFMLLTDKGALNPRMIRRWKNHLKDKQVEENSVWAIWNSFAAIPDDQLQSQINGVYTSLVSQKERYNPIIVKYVLETQPSSIEQIAQRYENALLYAKGLWGDPPGNLKDPAVLQIVDSLYETGAPAEIPVNIGFDFLDLFPDRTTQAEFKKVLEDVENYIRTDPAAPPRALVLMDNKSITEPYIFNRGNPSNRGEYVPRRFLSILDSSGEMFKHGSGRLELAQQIASDKNPLTARVMVNRVWAQLMGNGIVETPSDFGIRGAKPTHPELLDHLATYFLEHDWSVKSLIKLIVTSRTYKQSSDTSEAPPKIDPENELYWKANRKRLTWEQTRDAILHATGGLELPTSGESFRLNATWTPRRSVFSYVDRLDIPTLLRTFDYPSPNASSATRSQTTVPQQALWFFNNTFLDQASDRIAKRPEIVEASDIPSRLDFLYQLLFSRPPDGEEAALTTSFLETNPSETALRDLIHTLLMSNEFVYVN